MLRSDGTSERAEPLLKRAVELLRGALGGDAPRVGVAMRSLGIVEFDLGRLDEAERLLRQSLEIGQRAGAASSTLELSRLYLGLIALERGHLDQAEPALEQSLAVWTRDLGPESASVSWPLLGLARIHRARGDLAGAETLARRSLEIRETAYPADSHWIRDARDQLDQILREERARKRPTSSDDEGIRRRPARALVNPPFAEEETSSSPKTAETPLPHGRCRPAGEPGSARD